MEALSQGTMMMAFLIPDTARKSWWRPRLVDGVFGEGRPIVSRFARNARPRGRGDIGGCGARAAELRRQDAALAVQLHTT